MYTTPHTRIYFLQTRAGKLLALGLMLSSGVAHGLIMDMVYEKTRVTFLAILVFFLVFVPLTYALNRFRWVKNNKLPISIGFYLLLIAYDRISRPSTVDTPYFLGFGILFHLGWFIFFLKNTEKIVRIMLDQRSSYIRACNAYNSNDFTSAIVNFTDSIRSGNVSREVFYIRGMCYAHNDQLLQALDDFNRVIRIDPDFTRVYFWRGLSYKFLNDERAAADLERFLADCDDEELKDHARHHLQVIQSASAGATGSLE
jgi:tetratricopeptide (TPR) repeat protein